MCGNCRYTTTSGRKIICMNENSDDYSKVVSKISVCDNFEPDYTMKDTLENFSDNEKPIKY